MFQEEKMIDLFVSESSGAEAIPMVIKKEAMGKIMTHLTKMYSDPIKATVREVISNALDATNSAKKAGVDVPPVEIHSPSYLNPYFVVKDHGIGMTPKIVKEVFAAYGGSTKEGDSEQTGEHGLGAKSPLSYVSEFFFETTRDGYTSKVSVSRTDAGPLTNIIEVVKTDKPSGTVMTIPIPDYSESVRESFEKAIEGYKKYAFTMGQEISIDGEISTSNSKYLFYDEIILHEETGRKGKVWVNTEVMLSNIDKMSEGIAPNLYKDISFVISGFVYPSVYNRETSREESLFLVELLPKMVNFSPSRDDIINDMQYEFFEKNLSNTLKTGEAFWKSFISYYQGLSKADAYSLYVKTNIVDGEADDSFHPNLLSLGKVKPSFSIDDFTTLEGFNPLKEDLKFKGTSLFIGRLSRTYNNQIDFYDFNRYGKKKVYEYQGNFVKLQQNSTKSKDSLIKNFNLDADVKGLIETGVLLPKKTYKWSSSNEKESKLAVISVDSEQEIGSAMRNRSHINASHIFFVKGEIKDDVKKLFAYRAEALSPNLKVNYMTVSELRKHVAEKQKQTVEKTFDERFVAYEQKIHSLRDIVEFTFHNYTMKKYTVEELVDLSPIVIVLSDRHSSKIRNILNGLYEKEGDVIFDRPILNIVKPRKAFYDAIKGKGLILAAHSDYKTKSAAEKEALQDRFFDQSVKNAPNSFIPEEILKKAFLQNIISTNNNYLLLSDVFSSNNAKIAQTKKDNFDKWKNEHSRYGFDKLSDAVQEILDVEVKHDSLYDRFNVDDVKKSLSKNSLRSLILYGMMVKKLGSSAANIYNEHWYGMPLEAELIALTTLSKTSDSDKMKSAVADRLNEIIENLMEELS